MGTGEEDKGAKGLGTGEEDEGPGVGKGTGGRASVDDPKARRDPKARASAREEEAPAHSQKRKK